MLLDILFTKFRYSGSGWALKFEEHMVLAKADGLVKKERMVFGHSIWFGKPSVAVVWVWSENLNDEKAKSEVTKLCAFFFSF